MSSTSIIGLAMALLSTSVLAAHPEEWSYTPTLSWPALFTVAPLMKSCVEERIGVCNEEQPMATYPRMSNCAKGVFDTCGPLLLLPPDNWNNFVADKMARDDPDLTKVDPCWLTATNQCLTKDPNMTRDELKKCAPREFVLCKNPHLAEPAKVDACWITGVKKCVVGKPKTTYEELKQCAVREHDACKAKPQPQPRALDQSHSCWLAGMQKCVADNHKSPFEDLMKCAMHEHNACQAKPNPEARDKHDPCWLTAVNQCLTKNATMTRDELKKCAPREFVFCKNPHLAEPAQPDACWVAGVKKCVVGKPKTTYEELKQCAVREHDACKAKPQPRTQDLPVNPCFDIAADKCLPKASPPKPAVDNCLSREFVECMKNEATHHHHATGIPYGQNQKRQAVYPPTTGPTPHMPTATPMSDPCYVEAKHRCPYDVYDRNYHNSCMRERYKECAVKTMTTTTTSASKMVDSVPRTPVPFVA